MEFDHAGIATDDLDSLAALFEDVLGVPLVHEEEFDGLRVAFLDVGNGYFELLEPLDEDSTIATYLDRSGAGIHHLAVRTGDVDAALDIARDAGVTPIDDEPRPGAWGHDVAFLHPDSTGGVLLEFVER
jgi:methylmalonyl-CoA/ethylmalonyl-CoA epimerase